MRCLFFYLIFQNLKFPFTMKQLLAIVLIALFAINTNAQTKSKTTTSVKKTTTLKKPATAVKKPVVVKPVMKTLLDSASYAFGQMMASNLKQGGLSSLNYDLMSRGLKDAFNGTAPAMQQQTSQEIINKLFEGLSGKRAQIEKQNEAQEKLKFAPAIKEGEAFLAKNKTNPNIKTTASGLQYEIITQGNGVKPIATDQVSVHYKGALLNGQEFDSSYKREKPTSFGVSQVIKGWTEGLQLMQEGSKFRFYIPYDLAYGGRGAGANIPPFSTLVFEVELLKVNPEQ